MLDETHSLPDFTRWPSFPFEGDMQVKPLNAPVDVEPPRSGEDGADCVACHTPDESYIWVSERWRVRGMDRPTGLPMVLILECRSHLDLGDLPNLLAAELGVMTVRLERAIRSLDGVARVHVNRWGDGSAHLHLWFLARPYGRLQLRGTFLSLWDDILPVIPEAQWLDNLALVAAWLGDFGGQALAEPAHIQWQSPATFSTEPTASTAPPDDADPRKDDAEAAGNNDDTVGSGGVDSGGVGSGSVYASANLQRDAVEVNQDRATGSAAEQVTGRSAEGLPNQRIREAADQAAEQPARHDFSEMPANAASEQATPQPTAPHRSTGEKTAEGRETHEEAAREEPAREEPARGEPARGEPARDEAAEDRAPREDVAEDGQDGRAFPEGAAEDGEAVALDKEVRGEGATPEANNVTNATSPLPTIPSQRSPYEAAD